MTHCEWAHSRADLEWVATAAGSPWVDSSISHGMPKAQHFTVLLPILCSYIVLIPRPWYPQHSRRGDSCLKAPCTLVSGHRGIQGELSCKPPLCYRINLLKLPSHHQWNSITVRPTTQVGWNDVNCKCYPWWMRLVDFVHSETEFSVIHVHEWQKRGEWGTVTLSWEEKDRLPTPPHTQFSCLTIYSGWPKKCMVGTNFASLDTNILVFHKEHEFHTWSLRQ